MKRGLGVVVGAVREAWWAFLDIVDPQYGWGFDDGKTGDERVIVRLRLPRGEGPLRVERL